MVSILARTMEAAFRVDAVLLAIAVWLHFRQKHLERGVEILRQSCVGKCFWVTFIQIHARQSVLVKVVTLLAAAVERAVRILALLRAAAVVLFALVVVVAPPLVPHVKRKSFWTAALEAAVGVDAELLAAAIVVSALVDVVAFVRVLTALDVALVAFAIIAADCVDALMFTLVRASHALVFVLVANVKPARRVNPARSADAFLLLERAVSVHALKLLITCRK